MLYAGNHQVAPIGHLLPLWDILALASLQGDALFCLDAGDDASWPGSGTKWLDRSAGGYDWFLGEDGSAGSDEPTFTGTVGDLSEATYWALDGGDFFKYDSANEAFMDAWHKDSAVVSFVALVYVPSGSTSGALIGGPGGDLTPGLQWSLSSGAQQFYIENSSGGGGLVKVADDTVAGGWHMFAASFDEAAGAGGGFLYVDGAYAQVGAADTFDSTVSSPSAGAATNVYRIGKGGSGGAPALPSGARIMGFAAIDKACSKSELDAVWAQARRRMGI